MEDCQASRDQRAFGVCLCDGDWAVYVSCVDDLWAERYRADAGGGTDAFGVFCGADEHFGVWPAVDVVSGWQKEGGAQSVGLYYGGAADTIGADVCSSAGRALAGI